MTTERIRRQEHFRTIETGDTARNSVPGYLPRWNSFFMKEVVIKVAPLEEIGPRFQAMSLDPARDIKAVILTHFHHDHTGGLDFPIPGSLPGVTPTKRQRV